MLSLNHIYISYVDRPFTYISRSAIIKVSTICCMTSYVNILTGGKKGILNNYLREKTWLQPPTLRNDTEYFWHQHIFCLFYSSYPNNYSFIKTYCYTFRSVVYAMETERQSYCLYGEFYVLKYQNNNKLNICIW